MPAVIVFVEDEPETARFIADTLSAAGHEPVHAGDCAEGWHYARKRRPALLIIDVGLPDGSGLELCRRLRADAKLARAPIILLTAKGQLADKAEGFAAGADHYLVKPLEALELRLWVGALLRRIDYEDKDGGVLRLENALLEPESHRALVDGTVIEGLTPKEFDLLYELARRSPRILSKKYVLSRLWHATLRDNTVEVHIRNLRAKLGASARRIVTVPGVGYRFR